MPLIRNGTDQADLVVSLTQQLAAELRNPRPLGQPQIYDNRIGHADRYAVTVIWDQWSNLQPVARSRIILDAFEKAFPERNGKIGIAMGLTTSDAASMNLLPFAVLPHLPVEDQGLRGRAEAALRAEHAIMAPGGSLQLRFRTYAEAAAAHDRLRTAVPGSDWIITRDVQRDSETLLSIEHES